MKKIILLLLLFVGYGTALAQTAYISFRSYPQEDKNEQLLDAGGILILSKRSDLAITLTNVDRPIIRPNGIRPDGYYEYEVIVDAEETSTPKIEVSKRGNVYKVDFVVRLKPNYFRAYLIEEVEKPIRMEDMSRPNDAVLDASLAEIEIESPIADLQVTCSQLLQANTNRTRKKTDSSIHIISIQVPIASLTAAQERVEKAQQDYDALYKRMMSDTQNNADDDKKLEQLEDEARLAEQQFAEITTIGISAEGTNQLQIDISGLKPRMKQSYGILLLRTIEYSTECSAMVAEGGRQFALRNYKEARQAFDNALNSKDVEPSQKPGILQSIADADSCIRYNNYTKQMLRNIAELKKKGVANQAELVKNASAAIDFIEVLNRYNPCDFYEKNLSVLSKMIENLPLDIKFTVSRWIKDVSGYHEGGNIPHVELWANYSPITPSTKEYQTDKRFVKMTANNTFVCMGKTDEKGEVVLHLDRKSLPQGIFFRPTLSDGKNNIEYIDMNKILRNSTDEYQMRQFRLRMYTEK